MSTRVMLSVMWLTLVCSQVESQGILFNAEQSTGDTSRAEQFAERAAKRFYATLDFGSVVQEMFTRDSFAIRKNAEFLLSEHFEKPGLERAATETLKRAFAAYLNVYYLKAAFDLSSAESNSGSEETLPEDVRLVVSRSQFFKALDPDYSETPNPRAQKDKDLHRFIQEAEEIAQVYRGNLRSGFNLTPEFRRNIETIFKREPAHVQQGFQEFAIRDKEQVVGVGYDFFYFYLIEEAHSLRILTVGIGN